ncbi:hypothetical protein C8E97_3540 [Saccharothrix australiensis]|uniref:Uncharacterized protein n=1 Tax=Saccharothrix australiensis TaxID=2072 RepID=A0A495W0B1_9PSEU|nr:hypothetical protein C8E97_3540 [Saccharothrix australiensis]
MHVFTRAGDLRGPSSAILRSHREQRVTSPTRTAEMRSRSAIRNRRQGRRSGRPARPGRSGPRGGRERVSAGPPDPRGWEVVRPGRAATGPVAGAGGGGVRIAPTRTGDGARSGHSVRASPDAAGRARARRLDRHRPERAESPAGATGAALDRADSGQPGTGPRTNAPRPPTHHNHADRATPARHPANPPPHRPDSRIRPGRITGPAAAPDRAASPHPAASPGEATPPDPAAPPAEAGSPRAATSPAEATSPARPGHPARPGSTSAATASRIRSSPANGPDSRGHGAATSVKPSSPARPRKSR